MSQSGYSDVTTRWLPFIKIKGTPCIAISKSNSSEQEVPPFYRLIS
jgi:hypothetical protein